MPQQKRQTTTEDKPERFELLLRSETKALDPKLNGLVEGLLKRTRMAFDSVVKSIGFEVGKNKYAFADGQLSPQETRRVRSLLKRSNVFSEASHSLGIVGNRSRDKPVPALLRQTFSNQKVMYRMTMTAHMNAVLNYYEHVFEGEPNVTKGELSALRNMLVQSMIPKEHIHFIFTEFMRLAESTTIRAFRNNNTINQIRMQVERQLKRLVNSRIARARTTFEDILVASRNAAIDIGNDQLKNGLTWS